MADILVVEDDEDVAILLELILTDVGHGVRLAHNGQEGLDALRKCLPAAVVTDLDMPVLSGPRMAERMFVENCGRENIPVVLVSGSPDLDQTAAHIGTPYRLAKPFDARQLVALVTLALRERRLPRPPLEVPA